ncbi:MAG: class I SAM-dependent methyltransferase [Desulfobacteraceae bacterium]|nr:MAG: class I SAM-dependent methyltransferase [Desulfobacteraceae bacterium]
MNGSRMDRTRHAVNAWFLHRADGMMHRIYGQRKRAIYAGLPSAIVEIGPGAGANLRYYAPRTRLIAIEPNPAMYRHLQKTAQRYEIDLQIKAEKGEKIDLPDKSVSTVVGTLVLCSVDNPRQVLSEVRRILKPGGRFIFLEHVADLPGTALRARQEYLRRAWSWAFDGCHLNRETHAVIQGAGFAGVDMNCFMMKSRLLPFAPHIFGVAVN